MAWEISLQALEPGRFRQAGRGLRMFNSLHLFPQLLSEKNVKNKQTKQSLFGFGSSLAAGTCHSHSMPALPYPGLLSALCRLHAQPHCAAEGETSIVFSLEMSPGPSGRASGRFIPLSSSPRPSRKLCHHEKHLQEEPGAHCGSCHRHQRHDVDACQTCRQLHRGYGHWREPRRHVRQAEGEILQ